MPSRRTSAAAPRTSWSRKPRGLPDRRLRGARDRGASFPPLKDPRSRSARASPSTCGDYDKRDAHLKITPRVDSFDHHEVPRASRAAPARRAKIARCLTVHSSQSIVCRYRHPISTAARFSRMKTRGSEASWPDRPSSCAAHWICSVLKTLELGPRHGISVAGPDPTDDLGDVRGKPGSLFPALQGSSRTASSAASGRSRPRAAGQGVPADRSGQAEARGREARVGAGRGAMTQVLESSHAAPGAARTPLAEDSWGAHAWTPSSTRSSELLRRPGRAPPGRGASPSTKSRRLARPRDGQRAARQGGGARVVAGERLGPDAGRRAPGVARARRDAGALGPGGGDVRARESARRPRSSASLHAALLTPPPYLDPARLLLVWADMSAAAIRARHCPGRSSRTCARARRIEALGAVWANSSTITHDGEPESRRWARDALRFFPALGVRRRGRAAFELENDVEGLARRFCSATDSGSAASAATSASSAGRSTSTSGRWS